MAVQFYIKPQDDGTSKVFVRVRIREKHGVNLDIKQLVPSIVVDTGGWQGVNARGEKPKRESDAIRNRKQYERENREIFDKLENIVTAIEATDPATLDAKLVKSTVEGIVYAEEIERKRQEEEARRQEEEARKQEEVRRQEEARRISPNDYFARYIKRKQSDNLAPRSLTNWRQGYARFLEFQQDTGRVLDWCDLNDQFAEDYKHYLRNRDKYIARRREAEKKGKAPKTKGIQQSYNDATLHKRFGELRAIVRDARMKGVTDCTFDTLPEARVTETRTPENQVALTRSELDAIQAVDLSGMPLGYTIARDLFMIGVLTAQRVSDYNHIRKEDIETDGQGRVFVNIKQQKTGALVSVPCNKELRAILEKYDYQPPTLAEQNINKHIKTIARLAGITQEVETTSTRGGVKTTQLIEKCELCGTHTARRTGATLLYLAGVDTYDIARITGHRSISQLLEYIKADQLQVRTKIADKYDIFK